MNNTTISIILFGSLVVIVLIGRTVRRHLPEHHLSADSRDTVKLAMGLVATMTALLLGLLVSSAKGTYDTQRTEIIQLAAKVSFLGRVLAVYGPDASEARTVFRDGVVEAIHQIWPAEAGVQARLAPDAVTGDRVFASIQALSPQTETQRGLKAEAAALGMDIAQLRSLMLAQAVSSIPKPLLFMVSCWLLIIFYCFSLLAPANATTTFALVAAAISVAGAVFLILELDQPLGGLIRISSKSMVDALSQLNQ